MSSRSSSGAPTAPSWPDLGKVVSLSVLVSALISLGVTWGNQSTALAQKVDRLEFTDYVAQSERRFQVDSIERRRLEEILRRMEGKQDSTNTRLSRLICARGPSYCQ